jgi:hypothetical protein
MTWIRRLFGVPRTTDTEIAEAQDRVEDKARELEREVRHVEAVIAAERTALEAERRK